MKTKEAKKEKRISLVRYSLYSIGLSALILLGQFYMMIKNILP